MFEGLQDLASAWRTVAHISEWTGLSVGALAAGGALLYLVPTARKLVIIGAALVVTGWFGTIHGDRVGRADTEAEWADARKAAIAADAERDAMTEQQLELKYQPQLAALQKQAAARGANADALERKLASVSKNAPAAHACELGAAADRLPAKRPALKLPAR